MAWVAPAPQVFPALSKAAAAAARRMAARPVITELRKQAVLAERPSIARPAVRVELRGLTAARRTAARAALVLMAPEAVAAGAPPTQAQASYPAQAAPEVLA
jgi:hypothetical protein